MPLPIKTLRVLPNPWTMIHVENGPQGICCADNGGREAAPLSYMGTSVTVPVIEARPAADPRGNLALYKFSYPGLNATLTDGEPIEVSAGSHYYRDRLQDGSLVPADPGTAAAVPCMFKSMGEARDAGILAFEQHYGPGTFAQAFPALAGGAPNKSRKPEPATTEVKS